MGDKSDICSTVVLVISLREVMSHMMRQRQVFQSYMYCIYTSLYYIYVLLVLMLLLKCLLLETLSWEVQPCFCVVFAVVVFVLIVVVVFPVSGGPHSSCSSTLNCWSSCWSSSVWRPAWKTKPSPSWVFEACFCRNNQNLNKQPLPLFGFAVTTPVCLIIKC